MIRSMGSALKTLNERRNVGSLPDSKYLEMKNECLHLVEMGCNVEVARRDYNYKFRMLENSSYRDGHCQTCIEISGKLHLFSPPQLDLDQPNTWYVLKLGATLVYRRKLTSAGLWTT